MNCLIFNPFKFHASLRIEGPTYSLGIGYIGSVLKKEGVSVTIIDFNMENENEISCMQKVYHLVKKHKYNLIGCSINFYFNYSIIRKYLQFLNLLKSISPDSIIAVGGIFATNNAYNILKNYKGIDVVFNGESEMSIIQIFRNFTNLTLINGVTIRTNENLIKNNGNGMIYDNLDKIPFPIRPYSKNAKFFSILCDRGCNNHCSFCTISSHYGKMRKRSVENIIAEISLLLKIKFPTIPNIALLSSNFLTNFSREEIITLIKYISSKKICYSFCLNVSDVITKKTLLSEIIKYTGCDSVFLGIETLSKQLLKLYNKEWIYKKQQKAIDILNKLNIRYNIGFINFDFFSSLYDIKKNIDFIIKNRIFEPELLLTTIKPLPNTSYLEQLLKEVQELPFPNSNKFYIRNPKVELAKRLFTEVYNYAKELHILDTKKGKEKIVYVFHDIIKLLITNDLTKLNRIVYENLSI